VLSLNLAYKEFIDDLFGISSIIVPHGIEEEAFYKENSQDNNKVKITIVSEFIKRKNIDWVINAFKSYSGEKEIELNIVGDGPLAGELKRLSAHDVRIHFQGKVPRVEVLKFLKESDVFVLPSFDESFGLVYLEAAATSNAIIGLKNEGVWGVFKENEEMLFCADEKELEQVLSSLIDNTRQIERLKENAFNRASNLKWSDIVTAYREIYSKAIL
jgi:glycosyltransferase involved in cell wall biosynthesis